MNVVDKSKKEDLLETTPEAVHREVVRETTNAAQSSSATAGRGRTREAAN